MQTAPETDRPQLRLRGRLPREIDVRFVRIQIDIVEDDGALDRLFHDLRAPAGVAFAINEFMQSCRVDDRTIDLRRKMLL